MDTLFLTKEARIYNGKKITSSTSGVGKTGHMLSSFSMLIIHSDPFVELPISGCADVTQL